VPNTRLETSDGRMFQTLSWCKLPGGSKELPGEIVLEVKAMEKDVNGIYM